MKVNSWQVLSPAEPMVWRTRTESPGPGQALVRVAGCGICHTDLGFFYEGVPTRAPLPLTLGHEISGTVVETGPGAEEWLHRSVVVPAVLPCGVCPACEAGHGSICPAQVFPGCDDHGGFGTHVKVPARGLCPVPDLPAEGPSLADLSVIADAVTTPYQAIERSGLQSGDLAVFVGAGGVGGFGVQIAAAMGASVVAIDVSADRLELMSQHGADLVLRSDELEGKVLKKTVSGHAKRHDIPSWRWKIFETSGHPAGQALAFSLLRHGGYLSIVGFTPKAVEVRLSNLMAFDARVEGNWGCLPEYYPAALDLILSRKVVLDPFIERRSMSTINDVFPEIRDHRTHRRLILIPEG